jgi:hypothetical protein
MIRCRAVTARKVVALKNIASASRQIYFVQTFAGCFNDVHSNPIFSAYFRLQMHGV